MAAARQSAPMSVLTDSAANIQEVFCNIEYKVDDTRRIIRKARSVCEAGGVAAGNTNRCKGSNSSTELLLLSQRFASRCRNNTFHIRTGSV